MLYAERTIKKNTMIFGPARPSLCSVRINFIDNHKSLFTDCQTNDVIICNFGNGDMYMRIFFGGFLTDTNVRYLECGISKHNVVTSNIGDLSKIDVLMITMDSYTCRHFIRHGIDSVPLHIIISLLEDTAIRENSGIFNKMIARVFHLDFNEYLKAIFEHREVKPLSSSLFWEKGYSYVSNLMQQIYDRAMMEEFLLEIQATIVLSKMFSKGFQMSAIKTTEYYKALELELNEIQICLLELNVSREQNKDLELRKAKIQSILTCFPKERFLNDCMHDVRVKCSFNSIGTDTHRICTYNPNLYGMPKKLRACMLPNNPNHNLVEYDIISSQPLILALLSKENKLLERYYEGADIYIYLASCMLGMEENEVSEEYRNVIKVAFLLLINGGGITTLCKQLQSINPNITLEDAKQMKRNLLRGIPRIAYFLENIQKATLLKLPYGKVVCKEKLPKPHCRVAYVLQSIEAWILKRTLIDLDCKLQKVKSASLFFCLHDAITIECSCEDKEAVSTIVTNVWQNNFLSVFENMKSLNIKEKQV